MTEKTSPISVVEVACRPCVVCGKASIMTVDKAGYEAWQSGTHIQYAFPEMSADEREILISGTHPECWEILWKED